MEAYHTIQGTAEATYEEKKSQFIAQISFVETEEAALAFLAQIKTRHRTARHNVYAYVLRKDARVRYSDDGEPAKTSGLPTLEAIQHAGLTDVMVVTTRYFGGTLLGTGGLVRAYTEAAKAAIAAAHVVTVSLCVRGALTIAYSLYESALHLLTDAGARVDTPQYTDTVTVPFVLLAGTEEPLLQKLDELCRGNADVHLSAPYYAPF